MSRMRVPDRVSLPWYCSLRRLLRPNRCLVRRFLVNVQGATAVEFALVGPLFVLFVSSVMATGFSFFVLASLEDAVEAASRVVTLNRTSYHEFDIAWKEAICDRLPAALDCAQNVEIHVATVGNARSVSCSVELESTNQNAPAQSDGSGAETVFLVTVCYHLPEVLRSLLLTIGALTDTGDFLRASTLVSVEGYR